MAILSDLERIDALTDDAIDYSDISALDESSLEKGVDWPGKLNKAAAHLTASAIKTPADLSHESEAT
jgi:hypothetical protein